MSDQSESQKTKKIFSHTAWEWIGKAAVVLTIFAGIAQLFIFFTGPKSNLSATIELLETAIPPEVNIRLSANVSQDSALPKNCVRISLTNDGSSTLNDVSVRVPFLARITTSWDGQPAGIGEEKSSEEVGKMQVGDVVVVQAWAKDVTQKDIENIKIVFDGGKAAVTKIQRIKESSWQKPINVIPILVIAFAVTVLTNWSIPKILRLLRYRRPTKHAAEEDKGATKPPIESDKKSAIKQFLYELPSGTNPIPGPIRSDSPPTTNPHTIGHGPGAASKAGQNREAPTLQEIEAAWAEVRDTYLSSIKFRWLLNGSLVQVSKNGVINIYFTRDDDLRMVKSVVGQAAKKDVERKLSEVLRWPVSVELDEFPF